MQEAGAQMILLEAIPPEVAGYIRRTLAIPVLSIGAGLDCDGQLLIVSDLIGQFQAFTPKFVKKYCNVAEIVTDAMKQYVADVRGTHSRRTSTAITCCPASSKSSRPN